MRSELPPCGTSTLHHFKSSKCPRFGSKRPHSITPDYSFVIVLHHGREYGQNLRQKGLFSASSRRRSSSANSRASACWSSAPARVPLDFGLLEFFLPATLKTASWTRQVTAAS